MEDFASSLSKERAVLSKIDKIPDDVLEKIKDWNIKITQLYELWTTFEEEHTIGNIYGQSREFAAMFLMVTDEGRSLIGYDRYLITPEVQMEILVHLYDLWVTSKSGEYLRLLLEIFPQDEQDECFLAFLNHYGKNALTVLRDVKSVSKNPSEIKRKIGYKNGFHKAVSKLFKIFSPPAYVRGSRRLIEKIARPSLTRSLRRMGFSSYMAWDWVNVVFQDLWSKTGYSLAQKLWCYKHGFMPYRIPQYGLTKENYKNFLSDRDYRYLHPINNSFTKWINDKVSPRYVFDSFKDHFAECYFHLLVRDGETIVVPLADCPEGYEANYDGVLKLLRDKGDLAFKMSSGTHGDGFKKLSYRDGVYFVNNEFCHEKDIIRIFDTLDRFFIVMEYITLHKDLRAIYPESVNTIRLLVINEDGLSPFIGNAYMRIGSSSTGVTDNVSYGGVFTKIDIETGRYYNGERVVDHNITPCLEHPDTGAALEGFLPHWDLVKDQVLAICKFIPQLEYLGFDIAITDRGFFVVEINVHQDLHRFPNYGKEVQQYFWRKLEQKYERNKKYINKNSLFAPVLHERSSAGIDQ